ncbi:MAG: hypothetical protein WCK76_08485 [Elusimicrobiota bacterium]
MKSIIMFLLVSVCFPAFSAAAWPAPVTGRRLVCDSVDYNDKLRVFLDFDKSAASGDLEVFLQDMYPPLTLVGAPFRVTSKSGKATLLSDLDGEFNYQARLDLPADYAQRDSFRAGLTVTSSDGGPRRSELACRLNN